MAPTIQQIKQVTADHFGISLVEIDSARRSRHIVRPRQIAMHCAVQLTRHSLPFIAENFGKRDHTTVMHANTRIVDLVATDKELETSVNAIAALCSELPTPKTEEERAQEIAKHIRLTKSIEELRAEEQSLKSRIIGLGKHLAQLEKNHQPISAVTTAISAYEDAKFGMGELQASKAVFTACFALRKSFPTDLTLKKET